MTRNKVDYYFNEDGSYDGNGVMIDEASLEEILAELDRPHPTFEEAVKYNKKKNRQLDIRNMETDF